jgi:hypothetical protein
MYSYDAYGNLQDPPNNNLDTTVQAPVIGFYLPFISKFLDYQPTTVRVAQGTYMQTVASESQGANKISSQYFATSYSLNMNKAAPSVANTKSAIINSVTPSAVAGVTLTFQINPIDQYGSLLG